MYGRKCLLLREHIATESDDGCRDDNGDDPTKKRKSSDKKRERTNQEPERTILYKYIGGGGDTHTIKKIKLGGEITKKNWIKW